MIISLLGGLVKIYLIVLMVRMVMTYQECMFNPMGRMVASLTDPLLKPKNAKQANIKLIPVVIIAVIIAYSMLYVLMIPQKVVQFKYLQLITIPLNEIVNYLTQVFICFILLGMVTSTGSVLPLFFYRLGNFWVKPARKITRIKSNLVVLPAFILLFLVFSVLKIALSFMAGGVLALTPFVFKDLFKQYAMLFVGLLGYYEILLILRIILTWFSPDPRNYLVQLLYGLTEPVLRRLRSFIPPIGMFDLSALVAILGIGIVQKVLMNIIAGL